MDLIDFIKHKMSMTEVYQPVIIKELLENGGTRTKEQLAQSLAEYDESVIDYYEQVLMRWPKATLIKHGIINYKKGSRVFELKNLPDTRAKINLAKQLCDDKLNDWIAKKRLRGLVEVSKSIRHDVLVAAKQKCQLCGIPASLRPLHVDHIIPRSRANRSRKVNLNGKMIDVDSRQNLQALCYQCNCAKRDLDSTDFRRTKKLIRDKIPEKIRAEGRIPILRILSGVDLTNALQDKLVEELEELLFESEPLKKAQELVDVIEVAFSLGRNLGFDEASLIDMRNAKKIKNGGFELSSFYEGDEQ